jgi:hypothetical protein
VENAPLENLLIEHPSMSVFVPNNNEESSEEEQKMEQEPLNILDTLLFAAPISSPKVETKKTTAPVKDNTTPVAAATKRLCKKQTRKQLKAQKYQAKKQEMQQKLPLPQRTILEQRAAEEKPTPVTSPVKKEQPKATPVVVAPKPAALVPAPRPFSYAEIVQKAPATESTTATPSPCLALVPLPQSAVVAVQSSSSSSPVKVLEAAAPTSPTFKSVIAAAASAAASSVSSFATLVLGCNTNQLQQDVSVMRVPKTRKELKREGKRSKKSRKSASTTSLSPSTTSASASGLLANKENSSLAPPATPRVLLQRTCHKSTSLEFRKLAAHGSVSNLFDISKNQMRRQNQNKLLFSQQCGGSLYNRRKCRNLQQPSMVA